ncbi:hypothetical protein MYE70_00610 [Marinobacter alexandrii]|uniref:DUF6957 family protein n=1 Tax=Marinobacter alexandrii TaxID=2570351 RepID=UPI001FFED7F7|nr:hypothetical protein [Marinobacter alexandrii]MCK2147558.1 hypothetical protein [Marinobacter alexandrii]
MVQLPEAQTTAEKWYLVTIYDNDNNPLGKFFWGIVVEDKKRRFQPGHYVCSTMIQEELSDSLFQTANTLYEGIGKGVRTSLHYRHFESLRAGFSPDEIEGMTAMQGAKPV